MFHLKGAGEGVGWGGAWSVQQLDRLDNAGTIVFADIFYSFWIQVPHLGCGETN